MKASTSCTSCDSKGDISGSPTPQPTSEPRANDIAAAGLAIAPAIVDLCELTSMPSFVAATHQPRL